MAFELDRFEKFFAPRRQALTESVLGPKGLLGELNRRSVVGASARGQGRAPILEEILGSNRGQAARALTGGLAALSGQQAELESGGELLERKIQARKEEQERASQGAFLQQLLGIGGLGAGLGLKKLLFT